MKRQLLCLSLIMSIIPTASDARRRRVFQQAEEEPQIIKQTVNVELDSQAMTGDRAAVFEPIYKAISDQKFHDAAAGLTQILNSEEAQEYHNDAYVMLSQILSGLNMHISALSVQTKALEYNLTENILLFENALQKGEEYGNLSQLLPLKIPADSPIAQSTKSHFAYLQGKAALEQSEYREALIQLALVDKNDADFVKAKNLEAVVLTLQDKPNAALIPLQIGLAQAKTANLETKDIELLTLNVARTYFALKNYAKASAFYLKIPRESDYWLEAQFERAWSHFHMQDMNGSLGLLLTHAAPFFEQEHYPEAELLRIYSLFILCKFNETEQQMLYFEERYKPHQTNLKQLKGKTDQELFDALSTLFPEDKTIINEPIVTEKDSSSSSKTNNKNQNSPSFSDISGSETLQQAKQKANAAKENIKTTGTQIQTFTDDTISAIPRRAKLEVPLTSTLPRMLTRHFENDEVLRAAYTHMRQIERELELLSEYPELSAAFSPVLEQQKRQIVAQQGSRIRAKIDMLSAEIDSMIKGLGFTRLDITEKRAEQLKYAAQIGKMPTPKKLADHKQRRSLGVQIWPYEGEIWADELGYYKANTAPECPSPLRNQ